MQRLMQRDLAASAESQSYLVEALSGIAMLKAAGSEERVLAHWSTLFFKHLNISVERNHLSAIMGMAMTGAADSIRRSFCCAWGALYVLNSRMTVGSMLAINALAVSVLTPIASLVSSGQQIQLARAHLLRYRRTSWTLSRSRAWNVCLTRPR